MEMLFAEASALVAALFTNDAWEISEAIGKPGAWIIGFIVTLGGAAIVLAIYRAVPFIERHFERSVMVWSYLIIAGIIFVEVFRRFVLSEQAPWSTTLPPFLFLIMTWFGCSFNIKLRTHLSFNEFRIAMPPTGRMFCLALDAVLWFGICWIVVVTSSRVAANSASNFQILLGTDDVLQWWFLVTVPLAFVLMAARVLSNLLTDIRNYRSGEEMIQTAVIGGE
ncbi:MAG: TRAP transporter small permease subunit [Stappiaceae bacterium]